MNGRMFCSRRAHTVVWLAGFAACTPTSEERAVEESVIVPPPPVDEPPTASPEPVMPLPPAPSPRVRAIGVGDSMSCALLESGAVYCWGLPQLIAVPRATTPTETGLRDVVSLGVGPEHVCVARADGSVWCWGDNYHGQLGDGTKEDRFVPSQVLGVEGIVEVVAGGIQTCARNRDGVVFCWGSDGGVGHADRESAGRPGRVVGLGPATRLVAGDDITCAFLVDGPPKCWGFNTTGLLDPRSGPVLRAVAPPSLEGAVDIALGYRHACVTKADHLVYCTGDDGQGQLGDQWVPDDAQCHRSQYEVSCRWTDHIQPSPPPGPDAPPIPYGARPLLPKVHTQVFPRYRGFVFAYDGAVALAAGDGRSCAITPDGEVACWGQRYSGDWAGRKPRVIEGTAGAIAVAVAMGHGCALLSDHSVRCFGYNQSGELGTGESTELMIATPTATPLRW